MKILITGGAGFIGSHLSDYLVSKKKIKKVIVLDNVKDGSLKNLKNSRKSKKFSFFKADIRDFKKINNIFKKVDVVYHLAALSDVVPSIEEPIEYLNTNRMGTVNVLEAMRNNNVKKITSAINLRIINLSK
jgi:nucleoside-diphosphate-sugar epimerase